MKKHIEFSKKDITEWFCEESKSFYDVIIISTSSKNKISSLSSLKTKETKNGKKYFEIPLNSLDEDIEKYPKWILEYLSSAKNYAELFIVELKGKYL